MTARKHYSAKWLATHGYDGLCCPDCGCGLDNLKPCAVEWYRQRNCVPAHKRLGATGVFLSPGKRRAEKGDENEC